MILEGLEGVKNLLDDIIIAGRDQAEHDRRLFEVLKRLDEYRATVNLEKCEFSVEKVDFCGHEISAEGVRPKHSNVESIEKLQSPTNVKSLRSFLGATGY